MIIVIVGATATGKSTLAVKLAKKYNAEIISGDSMQVYKEMTIGTAKITPTEMENIPHYFINTHHYDEEYNVKIFQEKARAYIKDITSRNKNVIICGGTGLYIKALLYDYLFQEAQVDLNYKQLLESKSTEELYALLQKIDLEATNTIHPNNRKRIMRALLIAHSGEKKSDLLKKQTFQPLYDTITIGLNGEREYLYERINKRVDLMIEEGLEEEVKALIKDETTWNLQSMAAIGYREWQAYFMGEKTKEAVIEEIKKNTRHLAKRQYTFFNNQFDVQYFSIQTNYQEQVINYIEEKREEYEKNK